MVERLKGDLQHTAQPSRGLMAHGAVAGTPWLGGLKRETKRNTDAFFFGGGAGTSQNGLVSWWVHLGNATKSGPMKEETPVSFRQRKQTHPSMARFELAQKGGVKNTGRYGTIGSQAFSCHTPRRSPSSRVIPKHFPKGASLIEHRGFLHGGVPLEEKTPTKKQLAGAQ